MFTVDVSGNQYKVSFQHTKSNMEISKVGSDIHTWCFINNLGTVDTETNTTVGVGLAYCSRKDNFNRNIGRKISLTRALKDAGFNSYEREAVWNKYFEVHGKKN